MFFFSSSKQASNNNNKKIPGKENFHIRTDEFNIGKIDDSILLDQYIINDYKKENRNEEVELEFISNTARIELEKEEKREEIENFIVQCNAALEEGLLINNEQLPMKKYLEIFDEQLKKVNLILNSPDIKNANFRN